jgi:hypothetical protein
MGKVGILNNICFPETFIYFYVCKRFLMNCRKQYLGNAKHPNQ